MKEFPYKPSNGILKYLFNKHRAEYFNIVNVSAQSVRDPAHSAEKSIDWTTDHWVAGSSAPQNNYLSICFTKHYVVPTHFEIQTTEMDCRLNRWSFAASNDGTTFEHTISSDVPFGESETKMFKWKPGAFRCFHFINSGVSLCGNYRNDVRQIEFFGGLISIASRDIKSCNLRNPRLSNLFFTIFLTSMK